MTPKYYECHITIEPVFDERMNLFQNICSSQRFRVAKLLMKKDRDDTEKRSDKDSFCTGQSQDYDDLYARMMNLVDLLVDANFQVWRYKIEAILLDEKLNDIQS